MPTARTFGIGRRCAVGAGGHGPPDAAAWGEPEG
jgi:hypothetical protein